MNGRLGMVAAALALLAACETAPMKEFTGDAKSAWGQLTGSSKGTAAFSTGLTQYDDGDYQPAAKSLHSALDQGLSNKDQVIAHKYLAFIQCSQNRTGPCREEFRKALAIDPSMELAPAEAGHPIWGPIFQNVKAGR
ncbi:MAG TPA: TssQ family T6SS-associated lipoprotein [Burkholderiales bacterium]|jgi:Tfp pilus assembly protein PilF